MKLFKNIIRLLVLTSLGLSFTPLTTTKAATTLNVDTSAVTNKQTSTNNSLNITYAATNAATPVAEAASVDDSGTTTTDKEATSKVSVTVLSGILTLEAVPDFNFGTIMQGSIAKLSNNTADTTDFNNDEASGTVNAGIDGNTSGLLQVIDSRNSKSTMPGFTLSASMGQLLSSDNSAKLNAILHLSAIPLLDGSKNNVSSNSTELKTQPVAIESNNGSQTVMNMTPGSYNGGLISATFNTADSASLEIPKNQDSVITSGKGTKNMNAVVTWTLNAAPPADSTTK